ncbi:hypothetical protein TB2_008833 [Malus domestica]
MDLTRMRDDLGKTEEENPSQECTIVRTAGKLIPFHFNRVQEINDSNVPLETRRRLKRYNLKPNESFSSESFCCICNSPLSRSDLLSLKNFEDHKTSSVCCLSCRLQILPEETPSVNQFFTLLPQQLVARAKHDNLDHYSVLREQIQDCLLSEGEDET